MLDTTCAGSEKVLTTDWLLAASGPGACVGRIVECGQAGQVLVEFDAGQPKEARFVSGLRRDELAEAAHSGREVLIVFERGDPERPIVLAFMENESERNVSPQLDGNLIEQPRHAVVDGEKVKIEAQKEIVLECGKGSITIRRDGKILIKGTNLVSRSSGPHRIKGAHVAIN